MKNSLTQIDAAIHDVLNIIEKDKNATFSKNSIPGEKSVKARAFKKLYEMKKIKIVGTVESGEKRRGKPAFLYQGINGDRESIKRVALSPKYTTITKFLTRGSCADLLRARIEKEKIPRYIVHFKNESKIMYKETDLERITTDNSSNKVLLRISLFGFKLSLERVQKIKKTISGSGKGMIRF